MVEWMGEQLRREGVVDIKHNRFWIRGRLRIAEESDSELRRHVRTARFVDAGGRDIFPPLRDVQIVAATDYCMTLTGYEHKEQMLGRPVSYQQSWLLTSAAYYDAETARTEEYNRQRAAGEVD